MRCAGTLILLFAAAGAFAAEPSEFSRDVQPVFAKRCLGCHGPSQQMAGLRLDEPASLATHNLIQPGKAADSKLIERITSTKKGFMMPPMGERLSEAEVASIRSWIDAGAKVDAAAKPAAPVRSNHWAFQPVRRPAPADVRQRDWVRNPIDTFILAKLESKGIEPSPEAPKAILLRRVSLDLTGLPPTPAEVDAFLSDNRPDAYERVVDRLLASPHYGEKWARPWLDLARYADSDGYEKDLSRPWAWRYREWVINALNRDMPFDEFTVDQIAGDLLPNATTEQSIATGFHRNMLTNREGGVDRAEFRFEQNVNRTNTIGTVWLGSDGGMRAVPQPQVRSHQPERVLPDFRVCIEPRRERHRSADAGRDRALPAGPSRVRPQARSDADGVQRSRARRRHGKSGCGGGGETRAPTSSGTSSVTEFRSADDGAEDSVRDPARSARRQQSRCHDGALPAGHRAGLQRKE